MLLVDNLIFVSGAGKGVKRDFRSLLFQGRRGTQILNFLKVELTNLDFRSLLFQGRRGTDNPGVIILVLLFT